MYERTALHKRLFSQARELFLAHKYDDAADILSALLMHQPVFGEVYGLLGACHMCLNDYPGAMRLLEHAVRLNASQSLWSTALFQVYWAQGEFIKALTEMKRFLSVGEPDDYLETLWDALHDARFRMNSENFYQAFLNTIKQTAAFANHMSLLDVGPDREPFYALSSDTKS